MASKRKRSSSGASTSSSKRRRTGSRLKSRFKSASRTMIRRKNRMQRKSRRYNKKRNWKSARRIQKLTLSTNPYYIDTAIIQHAVAIKTGQVSLGGLVPIGIWQDSLSPNVPLTYQHRMPYILGENGELRASDQIAMMSKLGLIYSVSDTALVNNDDGKKVLCNYSKVQYQIRNNTNIALNLRMFHYRPRRGMVLGPTFCDFGQTMIKAADATQMTVEQFTPLTHPTDFPYFNAAFKIIKQKNVRLLPGELVYVSQITMVNYMFASNRLTLAQGKTYSKMFGFMVHGDPVHTTIANNVTTSPGQIDMIASYKMKYRLMDTTPLLVNDVHARNILDQTADINELEHVAAYANTSNNIEY